ncbi:MAG: glycosyltransferase [Alphaproteobacteria bacterium]|nr:glycosyltransferase [Alphaproteobacteria bacterium]
MTASPESMHALDAAEERGAQAPASTRPASPSEPAAGREAPPSRRLRIAITNPFCWPWVRRGSERMLHDQSHWLAARGHDVTVISSGPVESVTESYDGPVRRIIYPQRMRARVGSRFSYLHAFAFAVRDAVRRNDFDVVHCLNYHDAFGAAITRSKSGGRPRLILQFVGMTFLRFFITRPIDWFMCRVALSRSHAVVVLSQGAYDMLQRDMGVGAFLLPSPVKTEQFHGQPKRVGGPPIILFVGDQTERRKGARQAAQAVSILRRSHPDARLRFSGKITDEAREHILHGFPPEDRAAIEFLGVGNVEDLPRHYAEATVFTLPAIAEAFGMVSVEALAAGTPVVGCRHGGLRDIVTDPRIGVLVDPGGTTDAMSNVEGLAEGLKRAIDLAALPETADLCRRHAERFSWDSLGPSYEALCRTDRPLVPLPLPPPSPAAAPRPLPRVTVVIPTWRRPQMLERLLRSIGNQTYPHHLMEVIVVHREKGDGSAEAVQRAGADCDVPMRLIMTKYQGPGGSRHDGAMAGSGEVIALIDDDCVAEPGWIEAGVATLEHGIGVVQGRTIPNPNQPRHMMERTIQVDGPTPLYETCNIFYARAAFEQVGGVSPEFRNRFMGEDTELGWKVRLAGWATAFAPRAVVYHEVFKASFMNWLMAPKMYEVWPKLIAAFPELRNNLFLGMFLSRTTAMFDLGCVGAVLGLAAHPAFLALGLPYLYVRYREAGRFERPSQRIARIIAGVPRAAVGLVTLIRASIRYRRVVL